LSWASGNKHEKNYVIQIYETGFIWAGLYD